MSIKLVESTTLDEALTSVANAIRAKGGTSEQLEFPSEFVSAIDSIPTEGGLSEDDDVRFFDYDGTLLYSYSKEDFAEITEMPANPTHTGLTAQGWNWTLADAKSYVNTYGMLDIGQSYITDDGATRIYITIPDKTKLTVTLVIKQTVDDDVVVSWGDNNSDTLHGTTTSGVTVTHNYADIGSYVISIKATSGTYTIQNLFKRANAYDRGCQSIITKLEIGEKITPGSTIIVDFANNMQSVTIPYGNGGNTKYGIGELCSSLKIVILPKETTDVGVGTAKNCFNLKHICLPKSITTVSQSFGQYCALDRVIFPDNIERLTAGNIMYNCDTVKRIIIPNSVTNIGAGSVNYCGSLESIYISNSLVSVGNNFLQHCEQLKEVTLPNTLTTIGSSFMEYCESIKYVKLPNNITTIQGSTLSSCHSLKQVDMPNSLTTIANSFLSQSAITRVKFPASLTTIGSSFCQYNYYASLYDFSDFETVPTLGGGFNDNDSNYKIIVPDSLYETWIAASGWSVRAAHIIKASEWNS